MANRIRHLMRCFAFPTGAFTCRGNLEKMPKISSHFPSRDNVAGSARATPPESSIVKLHRSVSPNALGLASFAGSRVEVSAATMNHLRNASDVLLRTKRLLPFGAGNQKADIIHSQGEAAARTAMLIDQHPGFPAPIIASKQAAQFQGGKCRQHADVTYTILAGQKIGAPVMMVNDQHQDHGYCLIGDPRDPRWGDAATVVVDAWPGYPVASTLAQSVNRHPVFPAHYQRPPGAAPSEVAISALQDVQTINRDAVNAFLQSKQWPVVGHGLLKYLSENRDSLNLRDEKLAVQDPSVAYYSRDEPAGETMDNIAAETVDKQRRAHAAMDRFNSR